MCAIRAWRGVLPRMSSLVVLLVGMATNAQGAELHNVSYDVSVVVRDTVKKGSAALARAYRQFHYTQPVQEIFAKRGLRVVDTEIAKRHAAECPSIRTFSVAEAFGGWGQAQAAHFSDAGSFDKIMAEAKP